jgi:hypothetical protein
MMKATIHFEWPDGTEDSFTVEGTLEECQHQASEGLKARGCDEHKAWSEAAS